MAASSSGDLIPGAMRAAGHARFGSWTQTPLGSHRPGLGGHSSVSTAHAMHGSPQVLPAQAMGGACTSTMGGWLVGDAGLEGGGLLLPAPEHAPMETEMASANATNDNALVMSAALQMSSQQQRPQGTSVDAWPSATGRQKATAPPPPGTRSSSCRDRPAPTLPHSVMPRFGVQEIQSRTKWPQFQPRRSASHPRPG